VFIQWTHIIVIRGKAEIMHESSFGDGKENVFSSKKPLHFIDAPEAIQYFLKCSKRTNKKLCYEER